MKTGTKNRQIANAYYNIGLEKARSRDLSGAVTALKKSLRFDKYQTDARNLLGLIYNEIGEVGAALTQWVISLNLQEQDNLAEEYLRKVHAARGYLELADQAAKKYNQALIYAQNDNEDLATLLLMRMVEEFPQYVKAQELLALLYLHQEDYIKAGRCLYQALKIDRYNPWVLHYMDIAKHNTGKADVLFPTGSCRMMISSCHQAIRKIPAGSRCLTFWLVWCWELWSFFFWLCRRTPRH